MSGVMKTCVIKFIRKGTGISRTETEYAQNQSSTTAPTSGWNVSPPTWQNGYYIWQRIKFTYTDNSYSYSNAVCISGGNGISSVTEHYLATSASSGVTKNTSGWTTTVQTVTTTKKYLWNYETTTYTDGSTVDTTPVIIGVYGEKGDPGNPGGQGVSISSVTEYYLATSASSGVTRSTSGWTTSTQTITATKKYLWNYEMITYSDDSTSYTDPVIIGVYGDKGDPGDPGGKGDPGDKGEKGPSLRIQDWAECPTSAYFYAGKDGEAYKDVVVYNGNYYSCTQTHSKQSGVLPTNSNYWVLGDKIELVATNVLLATYSLIKNLGAEAIEMKDGNGNVVFYAKGGTLICKTGVFENVTIKGNLYTPYYNIDTSNIASLATYSYDSTYGFYYYALDLAKTGLNIQINPGTSAPVYISLPANSTYKGAEANILCTNYYVVLRGVYRMNGSGINVSYVAYNPMLYKGQKIKLKCIYDGGYKWVIDSKSDYTVPESPALIGFGETSLGYYSSGWSVSLVKNFNTCGTGAFTVSRIEDSKYRVYRPSSWTVSLTDPSLLISVFGKGYVFSGTSRTSGSPCKATLIDVQSSYFDVVTSDDDTKNDGEFGFTIHYAGRINSYVV